MQIYRDIVVLVVGLYLFPTWVAWLNYRKTKQIKHLYLSLLAISCALTGFLGYLQLSYPYSSYRVFLALSMVCISTVSFYFYVKTIVCFLDIHDRGLNLIQLSLIIVSGIFFISALSELFLGWNILFTHQEFETKNILINFVGSTKPSSFLKILGGINSLCIFYVVSRFSKIFLTKTSRDYYIFSGIMMTVVIYINDMILMFPWAKYVIPLGILSYFVEVMRISLLYSREVASENDELRHNLVQVSKIAQLGYSAGQVSHDIRNSLTGIIGQSSYLSSCKRADKLHDDQLLSGLEVIKKHGKRIQEIIFNYLDKMHDHSAMEKKKLSLDLIFKDAVELSSYQLEKEKISPIQITHEQDVHIYGFETELVMAFVNLMTNSIQAIGPLEERWIKLHTSMNCPENFTSGETSWRKYFLSASDLVKNLPFKKISTSNNAQQAIYITFEDSGSGISSDIAKRIFEKNFSTKEKGVGTGLGLSFVASVFQNHKGYIQLLEHEKNTKFLICLPFDRSA